MTSDVIILGAGPAGLATAAALQRQGIQALVLEQTTALASSWRSHYEDLKLNSVKWFSSLPYLPMPRAYPMYPTRAQFISYLEGYAQHFGIQPQFNTKVTRVSKLPDCWQLDTPAGVHTCRFLVVATGANRIPVIPAIPGLSEFTGRTLHSSDFRSAAPFAGERVLVVGSGNSGADIAVSLASQAAATTLVVRSPQHVSPQNLFGLFPAQITSMLLSQLPLAVADRIAMATLRLVNGNLAQYGIARPSRGPFRTLKDTGRVAILDTGLIARIKTGAIRVAPALSRLSGRTAWFADGTCATVDSIILATGYTAGLDSLLCQSLYRSRVATDALPDVLGQDRTNDRLFFVGYRESPNGMLRDIKQQAIQAAAVIAHYRSASPGASPCNA